MSIASPDPFPGLADYRSRSTRALATGCVVVVAGLALVGVAEGVGSAAVITGLVFGIVLGATGLMRVTRIRRLASRNGWRPRDTHFRVVGGGNGQPGLVLDPTADEPEAVLSVSTTVFRWGALNGVDQLWVTGNPMTRFAAVATKDFEAVIVVKRPFAAPWRRRLRKIALGD